MNYKEELTSAMFEAATRALKATDLDKACINVCLETAEICAKVLDWRSHSVESGLFATRNFLLFVEEIASRLHDREKDFQPETARMHSLLIEIYKRILNLRDKANQQLEL